MKAGTSRRWLRLPTPLIWGGLGGGTLLILGSLHLLWIRSRMEVFLQETLVQQARMTGDLLSGLPAGEWETFLQKLVRFEIAVYTAVLHEGIPIAYATAFEGFLPLQDHPPPDRPLLRTLPIGPVAEIYHPFRPGYTVLFAYPYFELIAWVRPLWIQSWLSLIALSLGVGMGIAGAIHLQETQARIRLRERRAREKLTLLREVTHELKSPLAVVSMGLQHLALTPDLSPEIREEVQTLRHQVDELAQRIQNALERTPPEPQYRRLRTTDLVETLRQLVAPLARTRGVGLRFHTDQAELEGDRDLLIQALHNLLRNAVEVSPPGSQVSLRIAPESRGVVLEVRDQGPGFPSAWLTGEAPPPALTTKIGGSGIGLQIAYRVARAHGGTLLLSNLPEGGGRARLWIPQPPEPPVEENP